MKTFEELKKDGILKDHNIEAYQSVQELFETGENKVGVVQATGTGKSYIALQFLYDNVLTKKDKHALILSPLYGIVDQFRDLFEEVYFKENVNMAVSYAHYVNLESLTDEEIKLLDFDYIVLDEFHGLGAKKRGENVKKLLDANPDAKILGLTATPVRFLDNNRDMGEEIFGDNIVDGINLADAIREEVLPAPDYVMAVYSYDNMLEEIKDKIERIKNKKTRELLKDELEKAKRMAAEAEGLKELFARKIEKKNGKYIAFCADFEKLESLKAEIEKGLFNGVNKNVKIYIATSKVGKKEALQAIKDFESDNSDELKILLCVDMLNEGVHIKNVDGSFMFRPTSSPRVYLQQLGRVLSVREDKDFQPLVFDVVNNIQCLDDIGDVFGSESEGIGDGFDVFDKDNLPFKIDGENLDLISLLSMLDTAATLSIHTKEEWLGAAERYVNKFGNLNMSAKYTEEETGLRLGRWLCDIRYGIRKDESRREADHIKKLLKLDPKVLDYGAKSSEEIRSETLAMLQAFTDEKGEVPISGELKEQYPDLDRNLKYIKDVTTNGKIDEMKLAKVSFKFPTQELVDQVIKINRYALLSKRELILLKQEETRDKTLAMLQAFTDEKGEVPVYGELKEQYSELYKNIMHIKNVVTNGKIDEMKLAESNVKFPTQELVDQMIKINPYALLSKQEVIRAKTLAMLQAFTDEKGEVPISGELKEQYPDLDRNLKYIKDVTTNGKIDEMKLAKVSFKFPTQELVDQVIKINRYALLSKQELILLKQEETRDKILALLQAFTDEKGEVPVSENLKGQYPKLHNYIKEIKKVVTNGKIDEMKLAESNVKYPTQELVDQMIKINPYALLSKQEEIRFKILALLQAFTDEKGEVPVSENLKGQYPKLYNYIKEMKSVVTNGKIDEIKLEKVKLKYATQELIDQMIEINPNVLLSKKELILLKQEEARAKTLAMAQAPTDKSEQVLAPANCKNCGGAIEGSVRISTIDGKLDKQPQKKGDCDFANDELIKAGEGTNQNALSKKTKRDDMDNPTH